MKKIQTTGCRERLNINSHKKTKNEHTNNKISDIFLRHNLKTDHYTTQSLNTLLKKPLHGLRLMHALSLSPTTASFVDPNPK
jgi:hypothetical protein